jgi:hypothetical protein
VRLLTSIYYSYFLGIQIIFTLSQVELSWDHDLIVFLGLILVSLEFLWGGNPLSEVFWDILVGKAIDWFIFGSFLVLVALIIRGGYAVISVGRVGDFEEFLLLAVNKIVLLHVLKFGFEHILGHSLELLEGFILNLVQVLSRLNVLHLDFDLVESFIITFLHDSIKSILEVIDGSDIFLWNS